MLAAKQLLAHPGVSAAIKFASERRFYLLAACGCVCVYIAVKRSGNNSASAPTSSQQQKPRRDSDANDTREIITERSVGVLEDAMVESVATSLTAATILENSGDLQQDSTPDEVAAAKEKAKRKKAKLKKTVIDGVNLVMGDSAGKFVESIIDLSQQAKSGGAESFVKSGKLGKLFSKDIIPVLKQKLQNKKFPTIVGTTDSPIGDLHYEVSGITLESLDIDPSLQCDITDHMEALQIKVIISSAMLRNISWKCGTAKIKEKGIANAEIVKAQCLFRISVDRSELIPKLSIKHCSIDIQQFNLDLHGGKASWVYNILTSVFSNKIKTKLKEKIDKMLTKRCAQFEGKINMAAARLLSLFSKDKKKKEAIEAPVATPHKKCFLYANEASADELECVLLDLTPYAEISELRLAFFDEIGVEHSTAHTRVRFRDRKGTLVSVTKSTTVSQLIEHAEHVCFYKDAPALQNSNANASSANMSSARLVHRRNNSAAPDNNYERGDSKMDMYIS